MYTEASLRLKDLKTSHANLSHLFAAHWYIDLTQLKTFLSFAILFIDSVQIVHTGSGSIGQKRKQTRGCAAVRVLDCNKLRPLKNFKNGDVRHKINCALELNFIYCVI